MLICPAPIFKADILNFNFFFDSTSINKSHQLNKYFKQLADMASCSYIDAGKIVKITRRWRAYREKQPIKSCKMHSTKNQWIKTMSKTISKVFSKQSITAELAGKMIHAAIDKAKEINQHMVIAILDESACLKAFHRMDGAAQISIDLAQNKAYTAVTHPWGLSTNEIFNHIQENPATLISIPQIPRYVVFGGGYVIKVDGKWS